MTERPFMDFPTQPDRNALSDDEFRIAWGDWIERNCSGDMRRPADRLNEGRLLDWLRFLLAEGWRAPAWPRAYGGLGLSPSKQLIYRDELDARGVTRWQDVGETLAGPLFFKFGTETQKREYLPRILNCQDFWCQGYSEPNSGSDLASLKTSARREGDVFVVKGQKVWTTYAYFATHCFALVRTGKYPKRQQGLSMLLIDMKSPGITVRQITKLSGEREFCEVFFDDVRVPVENLVGEIDQGWAAAKSVLQHERLYYGSPSFAAQALDAVTGLARELKLDGVPEFSTQIDKLTTELYAARALYADLSARVIAGEKMEAEFSILKLVASELMQRVMDFGAEQLMPYAGSSADERIRTRIADIHHLYLVARPVTIFAGTSEVQRDLVARILLPTENSQS